MNATEGRPTGVPSDNAASILGLAARLMPLNSDRKRCLAFTADNARQRLGASQQDEKCLAESDTGIG